MTKKNKKNFVDDVKEFFGLCIHFFGMLLVFLMSIALQVFAIVLYLGIYFGIPVLIICLVVKYVFGVKW